MSWDDDDETEGLGRTDGGTGSSVGGRGGERKKKKRVSCPISDSGDLYMSPEYIVLPDMSDSDGHCGPGIQRFPLLPIPSARPLYPCDKMRRRHVS